MKASEVPEKIYLQQNTTTDLYEELWPEWFEARLTENDIEYTRTDAFIDKACKWLENNILKETSVRQVSVKWWLPKCR